MTASPIFRAVVLLLSMSVLGACAEDAPNRSSDQTTSTTTEPPVDVVVTAREATFRVRNRTCSGAGTGSAILVDDRTLVTNRHVVEGAIELEIETWDGRVHVVHVARQSTIADLAVIRLTKPLSYGPLDIAVGTVEEGDHLTVVGFPLNGPYTATTGEALGYTDGDEFGQEFTDVLRMDVEVRPGNSGGPVLDDEGHVVAIVYAIDRVGQEGLAIPASLVSSVLNDSGTEPVHDCIDREL